MYTAKLVRFSLIRAQPSCLAAILAILLAFTGTLHAQTPPLKVALTFDDLPETDDIPPGVTRLGVAQAIIHALQAVHSPPIYGFLNAQSLADEPQRTDVLQAWRDAGFLIGNHTFSHKDFNVTPLAVYERDIALNEPVLQRFMAGQDWHWFRFPYLYEGATRSKREALRAYLKAHGYRIAEVSLDFQDYDWDDPYTRCATTQNTAQIAHLEQMYLANATELIRVGRQRARQVYGRDIAYVMLLHLGVIESVMLPRLLDLLHEQGFTLVTLPEAESDPAYAIDPGIGLKSGGTLEEQMMAARHIDDLPFHDTPARELDRTCR
jgi:peptidoglycan/xylan/chitin deacetylase (PgdA/CDA1 family)